MYLLFLLLERTFTGWIGTKFAKGKDIDENKAFWIGFFFGLLGWIYIDSHFKKDYYIKNPDEEKKEKEIVEKLIEKLQEK